MADLGREFPEELVIIILSLLPVKSLLRFKCVCKSWYSLLKSPHFIHSHLKKNLSSSTRNNECVLVKRFIQRRDGDGDDDHDSSRYVLSLLSYENETPLLDDDLPVIVNNIDTPFSNRAPVLNIFGPCNGLICLTNLDEIVLCNPATREFKSLGVTPLFSPSEKIYRFPRALGFGFDPNTSDYKVVQILYVCKKEDEHLPHFPFEGGYHSVEVYTLSTNCWRVVDAMLPGQFSETPCFENTFNGAFHWLASKDWNPFENINILSFSITDEVMRYMPLPDFCSFDDEYCWRLTVLNESLALFRWQDWLPDNCFEIWVMHEYGVKESWTRLFKIGPLSGIDRPLAFWKNSELLLETRTGQLVSCDLEDQRIKQFPIHGVPKTLAVLTYSESLVLINGETEKGESV